VQSLISAASVATSASRTACLAGEQFEAAALWKSLRRHSKARAPAARPSAPCSCAEQLRWPDVSGGPAPLPWLHVSVLLLYFSIMLLHCTALMSSTV
jgi:hypothetical protein